MIGSLKDNRSMRKDLIRDKKTAPKKLKFPWKPVIALVIVGLYMARNSIKEFFPGMRSADVAKSKLKEDMEVRHPITKLYFDTYKFDGAKDFADEFWKKCEDDLNNSDKAMRCSELVKNLIDREGSNPKIARAITDHYCFERSFSPFCNHVHVHWKDDRSYTISILERSCKELEDKSGCEISRTFVE